MNKKTKMYIGVGVVAVAAYYFWHKSQTTAKSFANYGGGYGRQSHSVAVQSASKRKHLVGADGIFANAGGGCPTGYTQVQVSSGSICCDKPDCSGYNFRGKQVR